MKKVVGISHELPTWRVVIYLCTAKPITIKERLSRDNLLEKIGGWIDMGALVKVGKREMWIPDHAIVYVAFEEIK